MKKTFWSLIDWLASKLGYFPDQLTESEIIPELNFQLNEQENQIAGLLSGFTHLQQRHNTHVLLLVALLTAMGKEEYTLKFEFLQAIYEKSLTINAEHLADNSILVKVVTEAMNNEMNQMHGMDGMNGMDICDECGGVCGEEC